MSVSIWLCEHLIGSYELVELFDVPACSSVLSLLIELRRLPSSCTLAGALVEAILELSNRTISVFNQCESL